MRLTEEQYADLLAKRKQTDIERVKAQYMGEWFEAQAKATPKPSKYRNVKTTDLQGNVHDSAKEHRRWQELELRQIAGEITELRHHVPFAAVVEGEHICDYEADFVYREGAALIVEDVKPKDAKFRKTLAYRHFRLKQKLVQALHKFQIREV